MRTEITSTKILTVLLLILHQLKWLKTPLQVLTQWMVIFIKMTMEIKILQKFNNKILFSNRQHFHQKDWKSRDQNPHNLLINILSHLIFSQNLFKQHNVQNQVKRTLATDHIIKKVSKAFILLQEQSNLTIKILNLLKRKYSDVIFFTIF